MVSEVEWSGVEQSGVLQKAAASNQKRMLVGGSRSKLRKYLSKSIQ